MSRQEHSKFDWARIADEQSCRALKTILQMVKAGGGRAVLVGGCVRDLLLGGQPKDLDVEVYGIQPAQLVAMLQTRFRVDLVGESFGVLKLHGLPIDVAIPRRESKSGLGHKAFEVQSDPAMSLRDAAARRDFTINSMALDLETGELIDPWGGENDLRQRILRHTSPAFSEDPLRVLRAMQFAARFDFDVAPETVALCRRIHPEGLPRERVFDEWKKLILKGAKPSRGLGFLRDCGWVRHYPELAALIGCEQEPDWHPEGDVWVHTLHCMDGFAAERNGDDIEDLIVGFAVLCHDLGKPATTVFEDGRIRSPGHDIAGEAPTRSFLERLTNQAEIVEQVVPLVLYHMRPAELFDAGAGDNAVRRLAARVGRIDRLVRVARADQRGRPPRRFTGFPAGDWLLDRARAHQIESMAPKPIVMGRHLIELGLEPGKHFRELLDKAYQAQLDAHFTELEGGLAFIREHLRRPS